MPEKEEVKPGDRWDKLRFPKMVRSHPPVQNAQEVYNKGLSPLDRLALAITEKIGSIGFFIIILIWTVSWCGYNILASIVPALHWKAFDPFPAFVAYLLISNVIQILLMPLIMVGQNLQGRYSDTRAQLDFEINQKSEQELNVVLRHLEYNTDLTIQLMRHLECNISDEEVRAIQAEKKLGEAIIAKDPTKMG